MRVYVVRFFGSESCVPVWFVFFVALRCVLFGFVLAFIVAGRVFSRWASQCCGRFGKRLRASKMMAPEDLFRPDSHSRYKVCTDIGGGFRLLCRGSFFFFSVSIHAFMCTEFFGQNEG